ncbi:right-handed parallel beta-helix repeat-containing protein [Salipiger sp. IMCC34102]|uniref:glycosyl hydrolase family 28-related protein n=1 Tax=Salipiger sp. IMCC34102 TaxID=2510647 RepID=UPI00101C2240|nr:glycosyl hydrolase family 28-related protein [Salipiger sp. IMCC34102]RYH02165.1 right-handed parallel beta-helix repeat-containing protein [Salipiger sp. IMCC34102]
MNKAITDGIVFQPLPFGAGLSVWSSGDGTPGSDTYATSGSGVFVPSDPDFGGSLEVQKTQTVQRVRYMGETPLLPDTYLRITARVKAIAGPLPAVRISGYPGLPGGGEADVPTKVGPQTQLTTYGEVVEISAIVGPGDRTGVDLVWQDPVYGHFGIDLVGPSGGLVRVDDIVIEDYTLVFLRELISMVDVVDYGARGDGTTDDSAAFEAADAAADGREILVPDGTFRLAQDVSIKSKIRFEGRVTQPDDKRLILENGFDLRLYMEAFGDEEQAFRKAYQALLNFSDHESLDMCGIRVTLTEPLDMQACDPGRTIYATRRVVRNGQFQPANNTNWDTTSVTSGANYSLTDDQRLTNVDNVANIPVGSLVTGSGVGREVYVTARNVGNRTLDLSQPLYDAAGRQTFGFTRFKYLLDFSGYDDLKQFVLDDIEFQCAGKASGILLAPAGLIFHVRDCFITRPKDRGITSHGRGCQGMMIDRCNFASNEQNLRVQDRTTIGFNSNAEDVKIRDNRCALFKHFGVIGGGGGTIVGNHWFNGDGIRDGVRVAGLIFATPNCRSVVTGNYIDNGWIEWTNEYESEPRFANQFSFGGLTVTGNHFISIASGSSFVFVRVKPYGPGHFIQGFSMTGNVFRTINGTIDRIEDVDTSFADLDYSRMRLIEISGNAFNGVEEPCYNPASLIHTQGSASSSWVSNTAPMLPFLGRARTVDGFAMVQAVRTGSGAEVSETPWVETSFGSSGRSVRFNFTRPVRGAVRYTVRIDNPT